MNSAATSLNTNINGTILAFDFGLKRIGVAVGNTITQQAQALSIISAASNDAKFLIVEKLIREWDPVLCVVGYPLHPDGNEHEMSVRCKRFANQLHGRYGVAVTLVDERYTSAMFNAKRGEHIDDQAAALILQQYFDQAV